MSSFLDQSAGYLINMSALLLKRELSSSIKNQGIDVTTEQWAILNRLQEHSGLNQKEVARLTFKDNANITRIIDKLVAKGFVERRSANNDRRSWEIFITEDGRLVRDKIEPLAIAILEKATKGLTQDQVNTYNATTLKIIENLTG